MSLGFRVNNRRETPGLQVRRFVEEASAVGIALDYQNAGYILKNLQRTGRSVGTWIYNHAKKDSEGRIISRLDSKLGPDTPAQDVAETSAQGAKRARTEAVQDMPMQDAMVGPPGGSINDTKEKHLIKNKKRKKDVWTSLLNRQVKSMMDTGLYRWQSLTPFEQNALRSCSMPNHFSGTNILLPVFTFNLSARPVAVTSGAGKVRSVPMYRLQKVNPTTPFAGLTTVNYKWGEYGKSLGSSEGSTGAGAEVLPWEPEEPFNMYTTNPAPTYTHHYTDVKLLLQGRRQYQTKYHIYVVSYLTDCGPRRQVLSTTNVLSTTDLEVEDYVATGNDVFWNRFLHNKVTHPLMSLPKPEKNERHMVIHKHHVVNMGTETSTQNDLKPLNHLFELTYKNNDFYNTETSTNEEYYGYKVVSHNAAPTTAQTFNPPAYISNPSGNNISDVELYVKNRNADKWLLIIAENFVRTKDGDTWSVDNVPSFDCVIRGKWTQYCDNGTPAV